jgi:DNA-binding CsgD family transcriptional regulator
MLYTTSPPERIWQADAQTSPGRAALLEILDRQSRAVVIVSDDGHPLHANRHANQLLATLQAGHRDPLRPASAEEADRFRAALRLCSEGKLDPHVSYFSLPRHDRAWPVIAELAPADPALAGPGTALVMLSDPMKSAAVEDPSVLQLLGLTAAEARIAAAVGAGMPPRETALQLGLQESTVRSALKLIFDKLGIGRQAELVQIVARMSKG